MKQFIIKLPEGAKLDLLDEGAQAAIKSFKGQFPSGVLVGSQAVDGYELKLIMADIDATVFQEQVEVIGLDWTIVAVEDITINQSLILPYMMDTPLFDEDGEQTGSETVTDVTGKLQTYSGRQWGY